MRTNTTRATERDAWPLGRFIALLAFYCGITSACHAEVDTFSLCKPLGYPRGTGAAVFKDCYKVGSFSHIAEIFPHNTARPASNPLRFDTAPADMLQDFRYYDLKDQQQAPRTIQEYLDTHRVTGLLILHRDQILFEKYQYDRGPGDSMLSHSMSKTILALLIGVAIEDGYLKSVDERVDEVLPDFKDSAFGPATIEDLLRMASGVALANSYTSFADNGATGSIRPPGRSIRDFLRSKTERAAPRGTRFDYNGAQTALLGLILRERLRGMTLTQYLEKRIWQPMGAEQPCAWLTDADGYEGVQGYFSATVRDYAKLGYLMANRGFINGRQVVPESWIRQMTAVRAQAQPPVGNSFYGYHVWLAKGARNQGVGYFAGVYDQFIIFDSVAKLVIVQTAVSAAADKNEGPSHLFGMRAALSRRFCSAEQPCGR